MKYTLEKITTLQACDALLAGAQRKKQNMERQRRNQGEAVERYRQRMDQLHNESAQVQISLAAFTTAYDALPTGKDKANLKVKVKRLEAREAMLEKKAYTYNVASLLVRELRYNRLDSQVAALEGYIAAVRQRRAMLDRAGRRVARAMAASYLTGRQGITQAHMQERSIQFIEEQSVVVPFLVSRIQDDIHQGVYG
jgi:prefoldin subunit 5